MAMGAAKVLAYTDLYLADPQIAALIQNFGGEAGPATSPVALEQSRLYGEARFQQLTRLSNAMQSVRNQYVGALADAQRNGGPGWVERAIDPSTVALSDEGAAQGLALFERVFDPDVFTANYIKQPGLANQAFAEFYGQSHTTVTTDEVSSHNGSETFSGFSLSFANPDWSLNTRGGKFAAGTSMAHSQLEILKPNDTDNLRDDNAVGFELEIGWVTGKGNIDKGSGWEDKAAAVVIVAVVAYISAFTMTELGYGAAVGMTGAMASGAVVGATTSIASGLLNDNLTLKNVLRGALGGALTGGLLEQYSSLLKPLGDVGTIALRTTVQGSVQALLGGSFKEGAIAGFASGLATVVSNNILDGVKTQGSAMSPADIAAARTLARVVGSAIRAVASPDDQLSAFGSSLLGDMLNAMGPPVAEGTTQTGTGAPPPATQTAFDDDGNLMPGVINTSASWEQQITQLQTYLQNQGMDVGSAQQLTKAYQDRVLDQAFETFVTDPVRPTLIAAGPGWTPDVRSARQVIDEVENRIANGSLQGRSIGNAIEDTFSAYARLSEAAMQQGAPPPTVDQERAASRLISLIGDLGQLASQDDWQLTPEQQTLVQQSRALQAQRNLPDVFGAAASGGILALRQNRAAFERVYGATKPTGALGGRPIGELEASLPNANSTTKGGIDRQNRTIETLAAAGYRVETIPRSNVSRSPDVYVEGRVFDVYSPEAGTPVRNIVTNMGVKASAQSDRIVLDLSQSDITRHELRAAFNAGNTGVREVIVIARDKTIYRLP
jgi:hypothetical protein